MYIALTERELDALAGADYALTVLYLYMKRHMDYATGIVGYARRISYQSISEALYIEPRQGVKGGSPHVSSIRRMLDQLMKSGVIRKGKNETLVFKLPYADTDNYVQNKADKKSTGKADSLKPISSKAKQLKADIAEKPKADTPHLSLNTINIDTSSSNDRAQIDDDDEKLIFHKSLHQDVTAQMEKILKGFQQEQQQELLDELSWYISKKKISATPTGLLIAMVKQAKAGAFVAANAHAVKKARENPPPVEKPKEAPTAEQREATKEKGRAAMATVQSIFNKRKQSA